MLLADKDAKAANPTIKDHLSMETKLAKYSGLILYVRELDEDRYQKLCAVSALGLSPLIPADSSSVI